MRITIGMAWFIILFCFHTAAHGQCIQVRDLVAQDCAPAALSMRVLSGVIDSGSPHMYLSDPNRDTDRFDLESDVHMYRSGWMHAPLSMREVTIANPAAPVPEPSSILLVGSGLLLVGGLLKRRQQQSRN